MSVRDLKLSQQQLAEAEATIHNAGTSIGISAVRDYIGLRRTECLEFILRATSYAEVAEQQGRVRELDTLLRVISNGPRKLPD